MANKMTKDLRNLSEDELVSKIRETQKAFFDLQIKKATGQLEKTADLWKTRKELARANTILSEKQRAVQKPAQENA